MAEINCRHFSGYKPCGLNDVCDFNCKYRSIPQTRLLIVHLGAMGAVLRGTSILSAIKRKFPSSHVTWVTDKICKPLLDNNPYIDRVLSSDLDGVLALSSLDFDVAFCIDKSLKASGLLKQAQFDLLYGFRVESHSGSIVTANDQARELWEIGLSDQKKFFENKKTENQLLIEALELGKYQRDPYILKLTDLEKINSQERRERWLNHSYDTILGINTGCADTISYKKLSVDYHIKMIQKIQKQFSNVQIVLLGGPQDTQRNLEISESCKNVILSPTENGIRDGLVSIEACDFVITGDSLGMHMSIALKKWTIAWFGPTCDHEIDLYELGEKILTQAECSPCWKRSCSKSIMCFDLVKEDDFISAIYRAIFRQQSLFKSNLSIK